ncbi:MAG: DUF2568 domain-containing protein [Nocardioides sp.]
MSNVALRGLLEAGIVAALALWGWTTAGSTPQRLALAILAPLLVFGFWGAVDFRFAGRRAEALRLTQELAVTLLAAAALDSAGHPMLAVILLAVSVVHHAAVYMLGERLLKPRTA